ncbi:MAG: hypothetical protein V7K98_01590 [Nostoc sp.]|uniref:hypothetical protein n=1 Tax=Nostoc sp. TaxID=1180 RepID=UPI002FF61B99
MIISDLSVLETVEESANIQGGDSPFLSAPLAALFPQVALFPNNNAGASASANVINPFAQGGALTGVAVTNVQALTSATVVFGVSSSAASLSVASAAFVPGPGNIPLLVPTAPFLP